MCCMAPRQYCCATTTVFEIVAHIVMLPSPCPGTLTVVWWPITFLPLLFFYIVKTEASFIHIHVLRVCPGARLDKWVKKTKCWTEQTQLFLLFLIRPQLFLLHLLFLYPLLLSPCLSSSLVLSLSLIHFFFPPLTFTPLPFPLLIRARVTVYTRSLSKSCLHCTRQTDRCKDLRQRQKWNGELSGISPTVTKLNTPIDLIRPNNLQHSKLYADSTGSQL